MNVNKRICNHPKVKSRRERALVQRTAQLHILETEPKKAWEFADDKQIKNKIAIAKQDIKNLKAKLHVA